MERRSRARRAERQGSRESTLTKYGRFKLIDYIRNFLKLEASAGFALMLTALIALGIANSPLQEFYQSLLNTPLMFKYGNFVLKKPLLFWINDGLMVIFFFLVGLEIKRECLIGHLAHPSQRILPGIATLGGILFPALIFILINQKHPLHLKGWAIPITTDIAFALGAVTLFGKKIPPSLKVFLMTVAVLDDLAAIFIIALFFTSTLSYFYLGLACLILLMMILLNVFHIQRISIYLILGLLLWFFVMQSGVHPTIAGVLAAFTIPLDTGFKNKSSTATPLTITEENSPLLTIENALHPWVAFIILPLFALANAGISFTGITIKSLVEPLSLGIIVGLFLGKQLGILLGSLFSFQFKFSKLPQNVTWLQLYGVSILCGIGFTMSLFMGSLAFDEEHLIASAKLGTLMASLLSFLYGSVILYTSSRTQHY